MADNTVCVNGQITNGSPVVGACTNEPVRPGYLLTKTLTAPTNGAAAAGDTVSFEITITNTGDVDMLTVPLTDLFDDSRLTFSNAVPPVDASGVGVLTWNNVGPILTGDSVVVTVNFSVDAGAGCLSDINRAVVTPPLPWNVQTGDAPYSVTEPRVDVEKQFVGVVGTGDVFRYEIVITNSGCSVLAVVSATDTFDSVFTYLASTQTAGCCDQQYHYLEQRRSHRAKQQRNVDRGSAGRD